MINDRSGYGHDRRVRTFQKLETTMSTRTRGERHDHLTKWSSTSCGKL